MHFALQRAFTGEEAEESMRGSAMGRLIERHVQGSVNPERS